MQTPIYSEIDLAQDGKQHGYLRLPHSVTRSAYGWIPIPIASIKRGAGPRVLIMAGNHGDEYEGQIIVSRLIREIDIEQVRGQLILLPMANYPAAAAGLRVSPIDEVNLNRAFPGDPAGSPTRVIAHYIEHVLMPGCQYLLDLHSGGGSLIYHDGCLLTPDPGAAGRAHIRALMELLHVPHGCLMDPTAPEIPYISSGAAMRQGLEAAFTVELAGGGGVNPDVLHRAFAGVLNFLAGVGALDASLARPAPGHTMQFLRTDELAHHIYAYDAGVFEPLVRLGESVAAQQAVALLHHPDTPGKPPTEIRAHAAGVVLCQRAPALTQRGDCLFELAVPV